MTTSAKLPPWYKTAIIYEIPVRAFCDSNADGIGDFNGLTSKLDYISDLGVNALWLLPFYPSPLKDGGYDIADYTSVNPIYGTLDDFKRFLDEAHRRGIKVITELVINHTSSEHVWFQRARHAPPGSPERNFYVWSDSPERYRDARIIFKDFEASNWTWDPVAKAYYWHRFYSHQPDLNFDNPAVHDAVLGLIDTWFGYGIDGLRLDAVPYLFEREGTTCENLPETHAFLKKMRAHIDAKFQDRMLLAEANQWPADAAAYFGDGDECHMNFHFPLMPRMFMALQMEDRFPIVDILRQTPPIPDGCQWATFLRNHDELTLEMVTDEERDYMYEAYSEEKVARINLGIRRRLAPLMRQRVKIELLNGLLMSLPGTPVLYYGDEIGMGDNVYLGDRDGVRTPMQWSPDRNAGFSRTNPQRLFLPVVIDPEYHYEAVNVEGQQNNPASLLRWMKTLIDLRKQDDIFGTGGIDFVHVENPRVLAFVRSLGTRRVLVVANLSRHPQHAELELAPWAGRTPLEMFGRSSFPVVTERPYPLSLAPHQFLWFQLEQPAPVKARPTLHARGASWMTIADDAPALARALTSYARERRWFRGKAKNITGSRISDVLRGKGDILFVVLDISFADAEQRYFIPVGFSTGEPATVLEQTTPSAVIATLTAQGADDQVLTGILYDALSTGEASAVLLETAVTGGTLKGAHGALVVANGAKLVEHLKVAPTPPSGALVSGTGGATDAELTPVAERSAPSQERALPPPRTMDLEQTNTTVLFGDRVIMKVFRQLETGINAEIEVGEKLTEYARPPVSPAVLGSLGYTRDSGVAAAAIFHELVENQGTAWTLFLRDVEAMLEQVLSSNEPPPALPEGDAFALIGHTPEPIWQTLAGLHFRNARMLGERTAAMHNALAAIPGEFFNPVPFTVPHQQSLYQGARALLVRTFELLARRRASLPNDVSERVGEVLAAQPTIEAQLRRLADRPIAATMIRAHGDLHLGQVLFTGSDFVIIDFEGEPARPLRERRYKRHPLRDVAGMMRSFSYAVESSMRNSSIREQDMARLRPWATAWARLISARYLEAYLKVIDPKLVPQGAEASQLLAFYAMEKCVYEVAYELNNRPTWLPIPIAGLLELVQAKVRP